MKDKEGNTLTWKEYIARWKEGTAGITPYQLTSQQLRGMNIVLLGLLCGIVVCFFNIKNLWWLLIILIGSLYVNVTMYIGTWQKKKVLENIEKQFSDFEDIEEKEEVKETKKDNYLDLTKKDMKGGKE